MFGEAVSGIGGVVAGEAGPDAADAAVPVREGEGDLCLLYTSKFQQLFVGKTVDELEEGFEKYCSDLNGRDGKRVV